MTKPNMEAERMAKKMARQNGHPGMWELYLGEAYFKLAGLDTSEQEALRKDATQHIEEIS